MATNDRRWSSSSNRSESTKFPDFDLASTPREHLIIYEDEKAGRSSMDRRSPSPHIYAKANGVLHSERWQPRKESHLTWSNVHVPGSGRGHGRQKSLSDAIRTIRTRKGSVSANAHEIADALKAPVSFKLIVRTPEPLCEAPTDISR